MANAQVIVSPTGMADEIGMVAEGMSPDMQYVAGQNQLSNQPAIWTVSGEVKEYSFEGVFYPALYDEETWEFIGYDYDNPQQDVYNGTFHAINNAGIAVGSFGSSYGEKMPCFANVNNDTVTYLYMDPEEDEGGDAYAVNADGSIIVGFHFDASWTTHACVWVNGGQTAADRVDLPLPAAEDLGFEFDYASARWMSENGSVVLGYVQDANSGGWVMIYWTRNGDGSYTVHPELTNQYYTSWEIDFSTWSQAWMYPNKPYSQFQAEAISANGEWVSLTLTGIYDLDSWEDPVTLAGRLNLTTGALEVMNTDSLDATPVLFGIANNGTCAGTTPVAFGPLAPARKASNHMATALAEGVRNGYVWFAGDTVAKSLQELYPTEEYFNDDLSEYAISGINADGTHIFGYTQSTDGVESWVVTSFIATLPIETAVEHVVEGVKGVKMIENGHVVIIREGVKYNLMGQKF